MTEYEYNLTFTVEKNSHVPFGDRGEYPDKKQIDVEVLTFLQTLVEKKVQEMSFFISQKERIN